MARLATQGHWGVAALKLRQVRIKNFRSIYGARPLTLDLGDGVNSFVGPNNAGKSNLMKAVALALQGRDGDSFNRQRDVPKQLLFAFPSVTLDFEVSANYGPEKTLLRYANEYERSVEGHSQSTFADRGYVRLRVKYQGDERQEFIAAAGRGDQRGDDDLSRKVLEQFHRCVRFVLVESGENLETFLAGHFMELLRSTLYERARDLFDTAEGDRREYVQSLQEHLLAPLTKHLRDEVAEIVPEISQVSLIPFVPTIKDTIAGADIQLDDSALTGLAEKGTGVRGGLLVAMLRYVAEQSKRSLVIALEEPESFLHPGAQELVREDLEALSSRDDVTLITSTHSPFIVSRLKRSQVACLAKTPEGSTFVKHVSSGSDSGVLAASGLFQDVTTATLLEQAREVPASAETILVVEGYSDKRYLQFAAEAHSRRDLIENVHILDSSGAHSAVIDAILMRARGFDKVIVLLDHDDPGRSARDDLLKHYKFPKKFVLSYREFVGNPNGQIEAEDLFDQEVLARFLNDFGDGVLTERTKVPGLGWHYGLSQGGKDAFLSGLSKRVTRKDCARFVEILEKVQSLASSE